MSHFSLLRSKARAFCTDTAHAAEKYLKIKITEIALRIRMMMMIGSVLGSCLFWHFQGNSFGCRKMEDQNTL